MNHEDQHELDGPDEPLSLERFDEYDFDLGLDQDQVPRYHQHTGGLLEPAKTPEVPW